MITKATWGGAQRYVYDLATHLPKDTFEVIVAYGESGRMQKMLTDCGIETRHVSALGRDVAFVSDIVSFFQLLFCVWKVRPDIVHLNSSKAAALGAPAARIMRVPRIVFTVHGWPFNEDRGAIARSLIYAISWLTSLMSHHSIVVSKSDEVQGQRMWKVGKKITYIPIGIELPLFFSRLEASRLLADVLPALKNNPDIPTIITIAELTQNKGLRYGIKAVASLMERGVRCLYIIIGDGEERSHLKSLARKCGVEDRVLFTGFIRDAAQYLKAADIFLLPSIKEGMPYVLLEAGAAGLPMVITKAVNPEIGERYEHARVVTEADSEALAEALIETMREHKEKELFTPKNHFLLSDMLERTAEMYSANPTS